MNIVKQSESINQKRWKKFKSIKRGYYSFLLIISLYVLSFFLPLFVSSKALVVQYQDNYYFPALNDVIPGLNTYIAGKDLGQSVPGEAKIIPVVIRVTMKLATASDGLRHNW